MKKNFLLLLLLAFSSCLNLKDNLSPDNDMFNEQEMLNLINEWRAKGCKCGSTFMPPVAPVGWNMVLAEAARSHSQDMKQHNYFSHTGRDGSSPGDRIRRQGYPWQTYGENIAKGYPNVKAVVDAWIKSEGHCKNIMGAIFKEMGVGKAGQYWTQIFATQ